MATNSNDDDSDTVSDIDIELDNVELDGLLDDDDESSSDSNLTDTIERMRGLVHTIVNL